MESIFTDIYTKDKWNMGQTESRSGLGSSLVYTEHIRKKLLEFINEKSIKTMVDTSCGDWNWMKLIKESLCTYVGIDIVKDIVDINNQRFSSNTITFVHNDFLSYLKQQPDQSIDLILCRHTLEHLPTEYNLNFLKECRRVCKYLFVTGYNNSSRVNAELPESIYRPINLTLYPYVNVLSPFYMSEFYDGPSNKYLSEMYMYIYQFTS
jgi:hypothetical protein